MIELILLGTIIAILFINYSDLIFFHNSSSEEHLVIKRNKYGGFFAPKIINSLLIKNIDAFFDAYCTDYVDIESEIKKVICEAMENILKNLIHFDVKKWLLKEGLYIIAEHSSLIENIDEETEKIYFDKIAELIVKNTLNSSNYNCRCVRTIVFDLVRTHLLPSAVKNIKTFKSNLFLLLSPSSSVYRVCEDDMNYVELFHYYPPLKNKKFSGVLDSPYFYDVVSNETGFTYFSNFINYSSYKECDKMEFSKTIEIESCQIKNLLEKQLIIFKQINFLINMIVNKKDVLKPELLTMVRQNIFSLIELIESENDVLPPLMLENMKKKMNVKSGENGYYLELLNEAYNYLFSILEYVFKSEFVGSSEYLKMLYDCGNSAYKNLQLLNPLLKEFLIPNAIEEYTLANFDDKKELLKYETNIYSSDIDFNKCSVSVAVPYFDNNENTCIFPVVLNIPNDGMISKREVLRSLSDIHCFESLIKNTYLDLIKTFLQIKQSYSQSDYKALKNLAFQIETYVQSLISTEELKNSQLLNEFFNPSIKNFSSHSRAFQHHTAKSSMNNLFDYIYENIRGGPLLQANFREQWINFIKKEKRKFEFYSKRSNDLSLICLKMGKIDRFFQNVIKIFNYCKFASFKNNFIITTLTAVFVTFNKFIYYMLLKFTISEPVQIDYLVRTLNASKNILTDDKKTEDSYDDKKTEDSYDDKKTEDSYDDEKLKKLIIEYVTYFIPFIDENDFLQSISQFMNYIDDESKNSKIGILFISSFVNKLFEPKTQ